LSYILFIIGVAESRYEIIINRRGAEDTEEKESSSFLLIHVSIMQRLIIKYQND